MRNPALAILGVCLLVFAGIRLSAADADRKPESQKWEYRTMKVATVSATREETQTGLNKLGADGWELCGVATDQQINDTNFFFKRPLKEGKAEKNESSK